MLHYTDVIGGQVIDEAKQRGIPGLYVFESVHIAFRLNAKVGFLLFQRIQEHIWKKCCTQHIFSEFSKLLYEAAPTITQLYKKKKAW